MSKLSVNTIAHTGGTTAQTIDSIGRILTPGPNLELDVSVVPKQQVHTFSGNIVFETERF